MRSTVAVLALLVFVTWAGDPHDDEGEAKMTYCYEDVCKELRALKVAMTELKLQLQQNNHQTAQLQLENDGNLSRAANKTGNGLIRMVVLY